MTKQQEIQLRLQARQRGYDPEREEQFVRFAKEKEASAFAPPAAPEPPQPKGDGFFKSVAKGVANPFLRTLDTIGRTTRAVGKLGQVGYSAATGDKEGMRRHVAEGNAILDEKTNLPFFGEVKPIEKPGLDAVGVGAELASNFIGGAGAKNVVTQGFKGLVKQSTITGVKAGSSSGAAYGFGTSLQKDNPTVGGVVKDTLKSGAIGGVIGGATGALTGTISASVQKLKHTSIKESLIEREISHLEKKYDEVFTGTKNAKKGFVKSSASGKTPSKFLAQRGDIIDIENGKINSQGVMNRVKQDADALEEVYGQILQEKDRVLPSDRYINLGHLGQRVKSRLNTSSNRASGNLSKMNNEVDNLINEFKGQYGDKINLSTLNQIKRGQWAQSSVFDATKPVFSKDVNYNFGRASKELLEGSIDEADIRGFNSFLGDHYDALDNLRRVDGNAVKGGRLGGYFARTVGAVAGSKAGPLGSIIGAASGDTVSRVMQATYMTNPVKRLILSRIPNTSPVYNQAQEALIMLKIGQKTLPAPKPGSIKGLGPFSKKVIINDKTINAPSKIPSSVDTPSKGKGALSRINDTLNEVTPGLSTQTLKIKNLQTEWQRLQNAKLNALDKTAIARYEKAQMAIQKQVERLIKTLGVLGVAGATKLGSDYSSK